MSINVTDDMIIDFSTRDQESLQISLLINRNYQKIVEKVVEKFINDIKSRISEDPRFSGLIFNGTSSDFFGRWWSFGFSVDGTSIIFEARQPGSFDFVIGCHRGQRSFDPALAGLKNVMDAYRLGNSDTWWYWRTRSDFFSTQTNIDLLPRILISDPEPINSVIDEFGEI